MRYVQVVCLVSTIPSLLSSVCVRSWEDMFDLLQLSLGRGLPGEGTRTCGGIHPRVSCIVSIVASRPLARPLNFLGA